MSLTPAYRFEICKTINGAFYWRLVARNGNVMADGGGYNTAAGARRAAKAVARAAPLADIRREIPNLPNP
jgi:uncharacterized protein YegP (UPF0339 family)